MSLPRGFLSAAPPCFRRVAQPSVGVGLGLGVAHWSSSRAKPVSPYSSKNSSSGGGGKPPAAVASGFSQPPPRVGATTGAGAAGAASSPSTSSTYSLPTGADLLLPPSVALDALPHDLRARVASVQDKAGFVPNIFLALAHRPAEFRAFFDYHDALMTNDESQLRCARNESE